MLRPNRAIAQLLSVKAQLLSVEAQSCYNRSLPVADKEAVQAIDAKVKEERKQAGAAGLLFAGRYLFLVGKYDKSKEYLDRAIKLGSTSQVGARSDQIILVLVVISVW